MAGDWKRVLRIADGNRYEVSARGRAWKPGDAKRAGPLPYVRSKVNGLQIGPGFRMLLKVAGQRHAASCFGVFHKLLEVGADQPAATRWLILSVRGIPGDSREIPETPGMLSELIGFAEKDIEKAMEVLTDPRVAWIEWAEVELGSGKVRGFPETPGNVREPSRTTDTESDTESDTRQSQSKVPPELADVRAYCEERKNGIDPEAFMAHYGRQGWKLGNGNAMKDWKQAIVTWEKNERKHGQQRNGPPSGGPCEAL